MLSDEQVEELLAKTDFPELQNDRILAVARREIPDKLPVWIMRQAGRYLPEFRKFRQKHSFFEICQTPKLAAEVTLMPIRRFALDAAIIFSDILVVPQALGLEVVMEPEKGPVFPNPLTLETLPDLQWENAVERLNYVGQAIRLTRHQLEGEVPLIGFSAAPWTLMVYMIEGGGTKTASKAKRWIYGHEEEAKALLEKLSEVITDYLVMQVEYGAQMLQIFESSAEFLNVDLYDHMMVPCLKTIREGVLKKLEEKNLEPVPMIIFAKGGGHLSDLFIDLQFEVLGIDWTTDPDSIKVKNPDVVLQGNLDPCALYAKQENLENFVLKVIDDFGDRGTIINLGHGIYPDTPIEAVECMIDVVHGYNL